MNSKFLHDMLVNWLYGGIRTLLFLRWAITVKPILKGTCIEKPPVPSKNSLNKWLYLKSACMYFVACAVSSDILSQKHLRCKRK